MKTKVLLTMLLFTVLGCSRNEKFYPSAIEQLTGSWSLQSRTLFDVEPLPIEDEQLIITEDGDIRDLRGLYERIAENGTTGTFRIDTEFARIIFTTSNDDELVYNFFINNITMVLRTTDSSGDIIAETWIKD